MKSLNVVISNSLVRHLEIMTDERLDHLAERYCGLRIGPLARVTFEEYVRHPDHYEIIAWVLRGGGSLQWVEFADTMQAIPAA